MYVSTSRNVDVGSVFSILIGIFLSTKVGLVGYTVFGLKIIMEHIIGKQLLPVRQPS